MDVAILRLTESDFSHAMEAKLDEIFFEASATQSFASPEARAAFRERWLGSYLTIDLDHSFVAVTSKGEAVGYLVGALADPARDPRYADLGYFRDFAHLTPNYPAHLHINVAAQHRSHGLGARLIDAFAVHARARNVPGMHICTGQGARNIRFYEANGFHELAQSGWNRRTIVMLGRRLI